MINFRSLSNYLIIGISLGHSGSMVDGPIDFTLFIVHIIINGLLWLHSLHLIKVAVNCKLSCMLPIIFRIFKQIARCILYLRVGALYQTQLKIFYEGKGGFKASLLYSSHPRHLWCKLYFPNEERRVIGTIFRILFLM